jgi:hypothetical protein
MRFIGLVFFISQQSNTSQASDERLKIFSVSFIWQSCLWRRGNFPRKVRTLCCLYWVYTVRPVPASTLISLSGWKAVQLSQISFMWGTFVLYCFIAFPNLNAPQMKHIWLSWAAFHPLEINESWCQDRSYSVGIPFSGIIRRKFRFSVDFPVERHVFLLFNPQKVKNFRWLSCRKFQSTVDKF